MMSFYISLQQGDSVICDVCGEFIRGHLAYSPSRARPSSQEGQTASQPSYKGGTYVIFHRVFNGEAREQLSRFLDQAYPWGLKKITHPLMRAGGLQTPVGACRMGN